MTKYWIKIFDIIIIKKYNIQEDFVKVVDVCQVVYIGTNWLRDSNLQLTESLRTTLFTMTSLQIYIPKIMKTDNYVL